MPASVEVRNVSRLFRLGSEEVWAVRDINLTFAPGGFTALIGRSGSGKTTLLNLIAGLDRPTSGEVILDGRGLQHMSDHELNQLRRKRLGFVFQSFGLLPLLSAHENIELPLRISGAKREDRARRTKELLDMVGLGRRAEHRPYELSGGEQQRVAIARALATNPDIILADEPTGELDSATATAIFTLLREVTHANGITVIACTHDRLVMEMADVVEELADGQLVTGQHSKVWEHVRARQQSPFAAAAVANGDGAVGLSSLIGADTTQFARPAAMPEVAAPPPAAEPAPEPEDLSRWSRPRE